MHGPHALVIGIAALFLVSCASLAGAGGNGKPGSLVEEVRRATQGFHDVDAATAVGYAAFLGCVSGPQSGAMGIHYVKGDLVGDGQVDASKPEALMYEVKGGKLHLVGVEFVVLAEAWDKANQAPPVLGGQVFHYTGSPNRYRLPAFYALHVWAWKRNPAGTFADWNPTVSCEGATAATHGSH
jgi:hypothetical protein